MALVARVRYIVTSILRGSSTASPEPPTGTRYLALGDNRLAIGTSRLIING